MAAEKYRNCVIAVALELCNVHGTDTYLSVNHCCKRSDGMNNTMSLDRVNVYNETLLCSVRYVKSKAQLVRLAHVIDIIAGI